MHYFIFSSKDSYITEDSPGHIVQYPDSTDRNYGADEILELKKEFVNSYSTSSYNVSRILTQFDYSDVSASIVDGSITSPYKFYLRYYEVEGQTELDKTYSLSSFPLSQSWEEGVGKHFDNPKTKRGVTWTDYDSGSAWVLNGISYANNGKSVTFDGTDDYVTMGNGCNIINTDDYSISVWFKTSTTGIQQTIVSKGNSPRWKLLIEDDNKLFFEHNVGTEESIVSSGTYTDGAWHHVVVTADRSGLIKMYTDGTVESDTEDISSATNTVNDTDEPFVVGTYSRNLTKDFNGKIDELSVFNKVLTPSEISNIYNSGRPTDLSGESGLVGYWRFENNLTDNSSNSNNGSFVNNATYSTDAPNSQSSQPGILTESGSRTTTGGGSWYINTGDASQSFANQSGDIEMDVTDMVNYHLNGTIPNYGFITKISGSQESDTAPLNLKFFSRNTHTIYTPKLEVRWNDSSFSTGSLNALTMSGEVENHIFIKGLQSTYRESEKVRFRIGCRKKYTQKTFTESILTSSFYIPSGDGLYSLIDVATNTTIVPFSSYTSMSCDSNSMYFDQWLSTFEPGRYYKILFKLKYNDGQEVIIDNDEEFKVI